MGPDDRNIVMINLRLLIVFVFFFGTVSVDIISIGVLYIIYFSVLSS